ncbi:hypothetical protein Z042_25920 [Chania multitudinisentens RB-25]|uniref:Uncharacterized protein n=1 Tax=Chania multitudinisentens RB-25 TaxID=1441930 RepID=A0A0D4ZXI5_9GAMM|nr:hypothetical protein [Chania multitudinisentens]AJW28922.1 hypothetical protein Z042_25920 [Chania multitudinisentens RB-25]
MSNPDTLFHLVKEDIHFDTLLNQAHQVVENQSGKLWTDTAEHDPGVTMLEGFSYGASDLAYRHTLPLQDLLTPAVSEQREGVFPREFGPHRALTCGPITADDYRKALLDLHSNDWPVENASDDGDFLFRNVQWVREPENERYTYWYDAEKREYSFIGTDDATKLTLRGNYWLYLEPTRQTQRDLAATKEQLSVFLTENRNIGESVSQIIWLEPVDFPLLLDIELEDDTQNIASIFASVYSAVEQFLMPRALRYSTESLQQQGMNNDDIFEGPQLKYGWIPKLAADRDYTQGVTLNLSRLANVLLDIDGIKNITRMGLGGDYDKNKITPVVDDTWSWKIAAGGYPQLWGADPVHLLAQQDGPLRVIAKGGISVTVREQDIINCLPPVEMIQNAPVTLHYGQHRDVGSYHPVSDTLPPCYELQHSLQTLADPDCSRVLALHQFMLPFEQLLANGCQQLAMLPQLLAFQRSGTQVWGTQWPFKAGSVNDEAHQVYAAGVKEWLRDIAQDTDQELNIINYLLGYFATQRAPHTFTTEANDFLAVQQGYLAQQTELTYHRDNICIDQVSPLQKRIAARMGLGGELFKPQPDLSRLPFYLIEHRALLPIKPNDRFDDEQQPDSVQVQDDENGQSHLIITQTGIGDKLTPGQVVNLVLYEGEAGENKFILRGQMIVKTQVDSVWLNMSNSAQLEYNSARVMSAAEAGKLRWQNSLVWLEDMSYRLAYTSDQTQDGVKLPDNQRRLTRTAQTPFPAMIRVGTEITLTNNLGLVSITREVTPELYAKVISFDRIQGTLIIERLETSTLDFPLPGDDWRYSWYFSGDEYERTDRFSFVISVVVNSELITMPGVDPYKLEEWVKDIILTEFPAHISMIIHWMDSDQFLNFGSTYQRWKNNGNPLGDASYSILEALTLGRLPSGLAGIGTMRIATPAQGIEVIGSSGTEWNTDKIIQNELFYVPKES